MTQNNPFSNFFPNQDLTDMSKFYSDMPQTMKELFEIQKKNIESFKQAQQLTLSSMQEISHRQSELLSQIMAQNTAFANDILREGKPEDKIARNSEALLKSYEQAIKDAQEISDMMKKANTEATKILQNRAKESLKETQACATQNKTKQKASA